MDIPVIKTFIFDNQCYFYDAYKNQLMHVSREQFLEICELQKMGIGLYCSLNKNTQAYKDVLIMINKGFFKAPFIDEVFHSDTPYIRDIVDSAINDLTLQVTRDRNFKCRYCSFAQEHTGTRAHERIEMPWEVAKKSIDYLYNHSKNADQLIIAFYGGEPLLNYRLIERVVEYSEDLFKSKRINYHMTTNGSILNESIVDFLIKYNFNLLISFDGSRLIQNKHRIFYNTGGGSFDTVYVNVNKLKTFSEYFDSFVKFAPVIFSDESRFDVLSFFNSIGIDESKIEYTYANMTGVDYIQSDNPMINNKCNNPELLFDTNDKGTREFLSKMIKCYANKDIIPSTWHHNGPCIPSVSKLFVNVFGEFYPCEKISETPFAKIGCLESGVDLEKVKSFMNIGKLTENECRTCWAIRFCNICILRCIDFEADCTSIELKKKNCSYQKRSILEYFRHLVMNNNDSE